MLILLLFQGYIFAQTDLSSEWSKYQFAVEVFNNKYIKKHYERFTGEIELIDDNTFKFSEKFLQINNIEDELKGIFTEGIFYPEILINEYDIRMFTNAKKKPPRQILEKLKFMSNTVLSDMIKNDSIIFSFFKELEKINPDFQTKRFIFWLSSGVIMNPQECYIELYNPNATENTTMEEFIKGAILIFYYSGTLII